MKNPETSEWYLESVNSTFAKDTFMSFETFKDQINLIGLNVQTVADKAFYKQGSKEKTIEQLKDGLNSLFSRRNSIAHQSDRNHHNAEINAIDENYVILSINIIEKIVLAIVDCVKEKTE